MQKKVVVSLSGGIDSTTVLMIALQMASAHEVLAVSFDYGQRHSKELDCAHEICECLGVEHMIMDMPSNHLKSALTDETRDIPRVSYSKIQGESPAYVPFRNGLMLSLLTGLAASIGAQYIMAGPHAEDAENWAYADCTLEFMGAMAAAIYVGTYNKVRLLTPLLNMTKTDVIAKGASLGAPYELTWSCYLGHEKHCGTCPTCRARKDAFTLAGLTDPTEYEA